MANVRQPDLSMIETRYADINALQAYTSLGRNTAAEIGREAGAVIRIGRRTVYDLRKIDEYMSRLTDR